MTRYRACLLAVLLLSLVAPRHAHAYLDPASGSILLQLLLGGVAGIALFMKLFWHKIQEFFGLRSPDDENSD